nr:MAG: hypothetical protein DIU58_12145 [Sphaerobacter thermophilus]
MDQAVTAEAQTMYEQVAAAMPMPAAARVFTLRDTLVGAFLIIVGLILIIIGHFHMGGAARA